MRRIGWLAAAMLIAPGLAQAAPATVQQEFERATALLAAKDYAGSLAAWEALERRTAGNPRSRAIVRVRKSMALLGLNRTDEALAAARAGLADLPRADASLKEDRLTAYLNIGRIAETTLDYAGAAEAYGQADALADDPAAKLSALRGLIETQTFVDPDAAARALPRAEPVLAAAKADKSVRAVFARLNGQLLLNQGAFAASAKQSAIAVDLLGGLTTQTKLDDVRVRSNYAIAALLGGDAEEARHYMAMTGAGRLPKGELNPAAQMKVPDCGGETGLRPDDVAVIDFSIDDDGSVRRSVPVYAAGGGSVALDFARTARQWSWPAAQVTTLPAFFRNDVRVELRCSTSFERPSVRTYLDGELGAWLASRKVPLPPLSTGSDAALLPAQRALLAQIEAAQGGDALALVPVLHALANNVVVPFEEKNLLARRETAILSANAAPPTVLLAAQHLAWATSIAESWRHSNFRDALSAALIGTPYADDASARAAIRLMIVDGIGHAARDQADARVLLNQVADDEGLPANHPLRVGALVRLASLEQQAGNATAAGAAFAKSNLSARQCALLDSAPRMRHENISSDAFPNEAMAWGFEGWTQVEFDVSADGKVLNPRAVVAYPPFVFSKAGGSVVKTAQYEKTYRPDGGLGCGGNTQRVRFLLP